jgi:hypothetical protein
MDTVEELCKKLRPVIGEKVDKLWFSYLAGDATEKREIEAMLSLLYARTMNQRVDDGSIILVPPSEDIAKGDYPIGKVVYNDKELYDFGIRRSEIFQHMSIYGRSGAGKTNTVMKVIKNFLKDKKPFLIFDWKRNYRDILQIAPKDEILIYTVGRDISPIQFNPLIPPSGTLPHTWLKKLIEILSNAYYVGEGVAFILLKAIDAVYKEYGVYEGNPDKYPTMLDVFRWLDKYPARGRERNWMTSTLRVVGTLCYGEISRVVNVNQQIGIDELLKKNVILELDALTNADKTFFIESLLLYIHHLRLAEDTREEFKHAIIIEEAHHCLRKEPTAKETIVDITIREIRELGEAIIIIDQMPSLISPVALANTYCTITMNLKSRADSNIAANYMLLNQDQKEYLGKLDIGYAIVKLQGRCFGSFLIKIPHIKIDKGKVSDSQIKQKMRGFSAVSSHLDAEQPYSGIPELNPVGDKQINWLEKQLIADIIENQYVGVNTRYKRLNISTRNGNKTKEMLITKGIIINEDIIDTNGKTVLLKLTKEGEKIAKKLGHNIEKLNGKAGLEHEYFRYKVAEYYKKLGYAVTMEKQVNGEADIEAKKGSLKIAIEIETGKSSITDNIKKNIKAGYENIMLVGTNDLAIKKINQTIKELKLDNNEIIKVISTKQF